VAGIARAWFVCKLAITRLPHCVLPLYPPIAILIAGVVNHHALARGPWMQRLLSGWFVFAAVVSIGMIVGMIVYGRQLGLLAWPFAAGATIFGLLAWWLFEEDGAGRSLLRAVAASILLAFAAYGVAIPALSVLFPSALIADSLRGIGCDRPLLASAGYHEPSLVFLAGTSTALVDGAAGADFLRPGGCRFAA